MIMIILLNNIRLLVYSLYYNNLIALQSMILLNITINTSIVTIRLIALLLLLLSIILYNRVTTININSTINRASTILLLLIQ